MNDNNSPAARQLSLQVTLAAHATFDNFYIPPDRQHPNRLALRALQSLLQVETDQNLIYLWGQPSCGISHLLQACCSANLQQQCVYLPLAELREINPAQLFDGLEQCELLCLDDLDCVSGELAWDTALFHLLNRWRERGSGQLAIGAHTPRNSLRCQLPDVISRLGWGVSFRVHALNDDDKLAALALRAHERGLELPPDALHFMASRLSRDPSDWFAALDQLDRASLEQQRKLTIPFIKAVLGI